MMSDYHEIRLREYEEALEQQYQEEYEREKNPNFYCLIFTSEWEEYADSEEDTDELISLAKRDGLHVVCTKSIEEEQS